MGLFDFFIKDIETSDFHSNPKMRTHYYKTDYRQTKDAILSYLKSQNYHVENIDDKYGEIFVQQPRFHMIFSIRKANVLNSSVDIKVSVYNLIGANRPQKLITQAYAYLDKALPFIGVGNQA